MQVRKPQPGKQPVLRTGSARRTGPVVAIAAAALLALAVIVVLVLLLTRPTGPDTPAPLPSPTGATPAPAGGEVRIPDTTKVLSETTLDNMQSISDDGAVFTFSATSPELATVHTGDVIVAGVSSLAPDGFLRRVTRILSDADGIVLETGPARLEDAIDTGQVQFETALSSADVRQEASRHGVALVSLAPLQQSGAFTVRLDDVVLVDLDGDEATRQDQVRANGQLSLEPRLEFDLKMKGFQIEEITVAAGATERVRLAIEGDLAVSFLGVSRQVEIARYYFQPVTVWVGWVPVVFTPVLDVRVGLDGSAAVSFQTSVTQEATVRAGLSYDRGNWVPIAELANQFVFGPPELAAGAGVRGYAGLELGILIYGVGGPQAALDAFLELDADLNRRPWLELYGGLRAEAGIRFEILGYRIADHSLTVLDEKVLLSSSDAPPAPPTATLAPTTTLAPTATWTAVPPEPTTPPTWTPPPEPAPTWTPVAGCTIEVQGPFAAVWQTYRARLGCPLQASPSAVRDAEQAFENGRMLWREDAGQIYVLYEAGPLGGTFESFVDTWLEGDEPLSCEATPPPGLLQPVRGFGRIWCQLGAAEAAIGWGLEEEEGFWAGYGDPLVQDFAGGTAFRDRAGTTQGLVYLLFRDDGSFLSVTY